jgi:glycosyltransferase domain-containing protein
MSGNHRGKRSISEYCNAPLTVLIPTHNRQKKLVRLLRYLAAYDCKIIIIDSSESPVDTSDFLNTTHIKNKKLKFKEKIIEGCNSADTENVVVTADDDFPLISEIKDQLAHSTKASLLVGRVVQFNEGFDKEVFWYQNNFETTGFFPSSRNIEFMANYSQVLWGCFRKDCLKSCYQSMLKVPFFNDNFIEIFVATWMLKSHGINKLDVPLCAREITASDHWGKRHKPLRDLYVCNLDSFLLDCGHIFTEIKPSIFAPCMAAYLTQGKMFVKISSPLFGFINRLLIAALARYQRLIFTQKNIFLNSDFLRIKSILVSNKKGI